MINLTQITAVDGSLWKWSSMWGWGGHSQVCHKSDGERVWRTNV